MKFILKHQKNAKEIVFKIDRNDNLTMCCNNLYKYYVKSQSVKA